MKLFPCCCGWSFVIGKKNVYGPIYPAGIGEFPDLLANTQHVMTRAAFRDEYAECAACQRGRHHHYGSGPAR